MRQWHCHGSRDLPAHPRGERRDAKPELLKHRCEEGVLLKAVAAALLSHQLLLDRWQIQPHHEPANHIDVLERNGQGMGCLKLAQRFKRSLASSSVIDA